MKRLLLVGVLFALTGCVEAEQIAQHFSTSSAEGGPTQSVVYDCTAGTVTATVDGWNDTDIAIFGLNGHPPMGIELVDGHGTMTTDSHEPLSADGHNGWSLTDPQSGTSATGLFDCALPACKG